VLTLPRCFLPPFVPPFRRSIVDFVKQGGVYMAGHELHVAATFSRQFYWTELNLWPEDLAPGSVVLLSGRDDLMNAHQVKAMLEAAGHVKVNCVRAAVERKCQRPLHTAWLLT
jgi:hypothetical protein